MSRCSDCQGSTPARDWTRCEECATAYCRRLMAPFAIAPPTVRPHRRWCRGDRVAIVRAGVVVSTGRVVRVETTTEEYVVDLEGGGRAYPHVSELGEP